MDVNDLFSLLYNPTEAERLNAQNQQLPLQTRLWGTTPGDGSSALEQLNSGDMTPLLGMMGITGPKGQGVVGNVPWQGSKTLQTLLGKLAPKADVVPMAKPGAATPFTANELYDVSQQPGGATFGGAQPPEGVKVSKDPSIDDVIRQLTGGKLPSDDNPSYVQVTPEEHPHMHAAIANVFGHNASYNVPNTDLVKLQAGENALSKLSDNQRQTFMDGEEGYQNLIRGKPGLKAAEDIINNYANGSAPKADVVPLPTAADPPPFTANDLYDMAVKDQRKPPQVQPPPRGATLAPVPTQEATMPNLPNNMNDADELLAYMKETMKAGGYSTKGKPWHGKLYGNEDYLAKGQDPWGVEFHYDVPENVDSSNYMAHKDAAAYNVIGQTEHEGGAGFGQRDMSWYFKDEKSAEAAAKALKEAGFDADHFNYKEEYGDDNDLLETPKSTDFAVGSLNFPTLHTALSNTLGKGHDLTEHGFSSGPKFGPIPKEYMQNVLDSEKELGNLTEDQMKMPRGQPNTNSFEDFIRSYLNGFPKKGK
jgi:hypothetical protein